MARKAGYLIRFVAGRNVTFAAKLWSAIHRVAPTLSLQIADANSATVSHSNHVAMGIVIAPGSGCMNLKKSMWFKGK
jgi:hypothetical protein